MTTSPPKSSEEEPKNTNLVIGAEVARAVGGLVGNPKEGYRVPGDSPTEEEEQADTSSNEK